MGKTFKNMAELAKYVDKQLKVVLDTVVAEDVKLLMQEHIQTDVYDQYDSQSESPHKYERTGGLLEDIEIDRNTLQNGVIITNVREDDFTGKNIARVVETGEGYDFTGDMFGKSPYEYEKPRPFTQNTRDDLKSGKLLLSFKKGMTMTGLKLSLK